MINQFDTICTAIEKNIGARLWVGRCRVHRLCRALLPLFSQSYRPQSAPAQPPRVTGCTQDPIHIVRKVTRQPITMAPSTLWTCTRSGNANRCTIIRHQASQTKPVPNNKTFSLIIRLPQQQHDPAIVAFTSGYRK